MISSRPRLHTLLAAGLLASAAFVASAQAPAAPSAVPGSATAASESQRHMHEPRDGRFLERMQEHRIQRLAQLKDKLRLNASQQTAWTTYAAALQPSARTAQQGDRDTARAEFEKLSTPQRLDLMQARQAERATRFARQADATRSFYAVLTPEQQKTFDAETLPRSRSRGHDRDGQHGAHGHDAPAATKG
ncbi:MAG: hypothetical protein JWQ03_1125 [Variovorax sp.]|nr:hypothetical protein [Variovorax sp.]